ncbi:MAG TPA: ceramidase domain-containing protein [Hyphomicrobiaceae bacterium]|nr:ceramidase domain-containing protein [Hyphomicrobiaceae bacterium]
MAWDDRIFRYCERGQDPAFWAEPLNAATNAAFIIAALVAAWQLARAPRRATALAEPVLIALVLVIGVGSFLFHTTATRWASLADTGPIGLFMVAYLAYALRRYFALPWIWVGAGLAIFMWTLHGAVGVHCRTGLLPVTEAAGGACLNGTAGYVPAWLALSGMAAALLVKRHPAGRTLAWAAALLLVSMTFRTIDLEVCPLARVAGRAIGTHFLWHLLNATLLYVLLLAAIRHGRGSEPAIALPPPPSHKGAR